MKKLLFFIPFLFLLCSCKIINFFPTDSPNEPSQPEEVKIDNGTVYSFTDNLKHNGPLTTGAFPSLGKPNLLVIPINFDQGNATPKVLADLNLAFNGSKDELGYYSVKEYYYVSSYGKLDMNIDVLDSFYTPEHSKNYYETYETALDTGSSLLLKEALSYYDEQIDYTKYDYDNDGYIDAVWLIYNCPVSFSGNSDFWWAYQTFNLTEEKYDGVEAFYYAFAGTDFMYDKYHVAYDPTNILIDAHTYIHETGHLMGLDDYYDYDSNRGLDDPGTYAADMMDSTFGDHGPISKLLLGWISPTIINADFNGTIESFASTGNTYLITDSFRGTIYDSYYLLILYDETGINGLDRPLNFTSNNTGLLLYEVHAEINYDSKGEITYNGGSYSTGFKYDNSDTYKKFVRMIPSLGTLENSILLKEGTSLKTSDMFFTLTVGYTNNKFNFSITY